MNKKTFKKALKEAANWDRNLSDRQRTMIPYAEAKKEKITEIFEKYYKDEK